MNRFENFRMQFPVFNEGVFMNFAGVAPVSFAVKEAVIRWAEAGSKGDFNYVELINNAREIYSKLLNSSHDGIFFTRNTTHGLQLFVLGYPWQEGDSVVIADCEFPANRLPWLDLEKRGVNVRVVKARDYKVDLSHFMSHCDSTTKALSISWVQYLSGQRTDIVKLGQFCRKRGILFVLDAIQGLGVIPCNVEEACVDWLSADGHKWLCGPEGAGIGRASERALNIIDPPSKGWLSVAHPFNFEDFNQEYATDAQKYQEGSLNIVGIMALNAAVSMLQNADINSIHERVEELAGYAIKSIKERNFDLLTPELREERAGIISFKTRKEPIKHFEDLKKENCTCSVRGGFLRLSPHAANREEDIDRIFDIIDHG